jgi:hypothetical protein
MTLSARPAVVDVLIPRFDVLPVFRMGISPAAIMTFYTHIRLRMARLAGLEIPPSLRSMIRIPVIDLGTAACLAVGFDLHAALLAQFGVTVRAGFRIMAAVAVLGITRRLHGMGRDEIGPVRLGHVVTLARRTPL